MKLIRLRRTDKDEIRTFGRIEAENGRIVCNATLEHPEKDEDHDGFTDHNTSCIPAGTYEGFIRVSHKHGGDGAHDYDVPQLIGVPHRDAVELHIGNTLKNTRGCILVGTTIAKGADEPMILGSKPAHDALMKELAGETRFRLEVIDP